MKKNILFFFFMTVLAFQVTATAAQTKFASYPRQVSHVVSKIERLPEAQELLAQVNLEGPVKITVLPSRSEFDAFWNNDSRTILLSPAGMNKPGKLISSILFELHNASTDREMTILYRRAQTGAITKSAFVESMERLEHTNALNTSKLLAKGIKLGIFPKDAAWGVPENFSEYFHYQQRVGHSGWHARTYESLRNSG